MSRPLLITDCDEVLLHMVSHFAEWLDEAHDLAFDLKAPGFRDAIKTRDGAAFAAEKVWPLLDGFFTSEMHRQNIVPGAAEALARIGEKAKVSIGAVVTRDVPSGTTVSGNFAIPHDRFLNHLRSVR